MYCDTKIRLFVLTVSKGGIRLSQQDKWYFLLLHTVFKTRFWKRKEKKYNSQGEIALKMISHWRHFHKVISCRIIWNRDGCVFKCRVLIPQIANG